MEDVRLPLRGERTTNMERRPPRVALEMKLGEMTMREERRLRPRRRDLHQLSEQSLRLAHMALLHRALCAVA